MPNRESRSQTLYTSNGARKYLTDVERDRFIRTAYAANPRDRALCLTIAFTGCRISEVLAIRAGSLVPDEGLITVRTLKRRRVHFRAIPVPAFLFDAIAAGSACGRDYDPDRRLFPITRSRAWQITKALLREAGIGPGPHATCKAFRHSLALKAVRSGVPINLVQKWLGHANLASSLSYLDFVTPDERAMAMRMWEV